MRCTFGVAPACLIVLPDKMVLTSNMPALNESSKLMCNRAGVISVNMPGQMTEQIP